MSIHQALDIVLDDFVLVRADWSVGQAIDLIESLSPGFVIVHRLDGADEFFYLRAVGDFDDASRELSVADALDLHEWQADPVVDGVAPIADSIDRAIVVSDGLILGCVGTDVSDMQERRVPVFRDPAPRAAPPDPPRAAPPAPPIVTRGGGGVTRGGGAREAAPEEPSETDETGEIGEVVRHLEVEHPKQVTVGDELDVLVALAGEEHADPGSVAIIRAEVGESVDLVMSTRSGVQLENASTQRLVVNEDGTKVFCQFRLRAVEEGTASALLLAFIDGAQVAAVPIGIEVSAQGVTVDRSTMLREADVESASRRQPDLMLLIYEQTIEGQKLLQFQLHGHDADLGLNMAQFGPVKLEVDPARYFTTYFAEIEDLLLDNAPPPAEIEQRMKSLGATLYEEVVPVDLRAKLWEVRDRVQHVLVQSTDPWIPWEMCFITGPTDDGTIVEHGYLCERYEMSRWIQPTPLRPELSLANIGLIVTGDSGLAMAMEERSDVLSLGAGGRTVGEVPAEYLALTNALAGGTFTSIHFTGHGLFADDSDPDKTHIMLENHKRFTAQDISGRVANLGKAQPFVFLNACQAGRSGMTLAGVGGWAKALLTAGAGAFVGAHWSVLDASAVTFSRVMYERLLEGDTAPAAVRAARLAIKSAGDPTWLAYTLYSDPFARIT